MYDKLEGKVGSVTSEEAETRLVLNFTEIPGVSREPITVSYKIPAKTNIKEGDKVVFHNIRPSVIQKADGLLAIVHKAYDSVNFSRKSLKFFSTTVYKAEGPELANLQKQRDNTYKPY